MITIQQLSQCLVTDNTQELSMMLSEFKGILRTLVSGAVDYEVSEEADFVRKVFVQFPNGIEFLSCWERVEEVLFYVL